MTPPPYLEQPLGKKCYDSYIGKHTIVFIFSIVKIIAQFYKHSMIQNSFFMKIKSTKIQMGQNFIKIYSHQIAP